MIRLPISSADIQQMHLCAICYDTEMFPCWLFLVASLSPLSTSAFPQCLNVPLQRIICSIEGLQDPAPELRSISILRSVPTLYQLIKVFNIIRFVRVVVRIKTGLICVDGCIIVLGAL